MSRFKLELCSYIIKENYGELVEKVAMLIAKNGPSQLKTIIKRTGCDVKQVSAFYRSRVSAIADLRARLSAQRAEHRCQRLNRLSGQTRPLSSSGCQPLSSQLSLR